MVEYYSLTFLMLLLVAFYRVENMQSLHTHPDDLRVLRAAEG